MELENLSQDQQLKETTSIDIPKEDQSSNTNENAKQYFFLDLATSPQVAYFSNEFADYFNTPYNFLKGVKWSPDGSCFLSSSEDNTLRLFEIPSEYSDYSGPKMLNSVLKVEEAETIYDFCWYPQMNSLDPTTCCFLSTSRDHPIHLWDAFTGKLRCSYRAFDQMDELTSAFSLSFDTNGEKIYCGFNKTIRIFDVSIPGRSCFEIKCFTKTQPHQGQHGIISCLSFNPDFSGIFAAGSYSNSVGLYNQSDRNSLLYTLPTEYGVTQVQFSPNGLYLFTGGRKSNMITCWDIRNTGQALYQLYRAANTNQRIYFDIHPSGRHLATGSQDNKVLLYDLVSGELVCSLLNHEDAVNGCHFHPKLPLLATSSGQRKFDLPVDNREDSQDEKRDARILVWQFSYFWEQIQMESSSKEERA